MTPLSFPETLKVANNSSPSLVAGAIAGQIRQYQSAVINAIGAAAVNQTIKSIAVAQIYLHTEGVSISFKCQFKHHIVDGEEYTFLQFYVQAQ